PPDASPARPSPDGVSDPSAAPPVEVARVCTAAPTSSAPSPTHPDVGDPRNSPHNDTTKSPRNSGYTRAPGIPLFFCVTPGVGGPASLATPCPTPVYRWPG